MLDIWAKRLYQALLEAQMYMFCDVSFKIVFTLVPDKNHQILQQCKV